MWKWIVGCGFVLAAFGCASDVGEPIRGATSGIVNGRPTTDDPWAVAVVNLGFSGQGGLCSGSLVGNYGVVTAKHCVYRERSDGRWEATPVNELLVLVASDVTTSSGVMQRAEVHSVVSTPGVYSDADLNNGTDIAVVLLKSRFTGVTPIGVATSLPSSGAAARILGFGRTNDNEADDTSGVKHTGNTSILRAGSALIEAGGTSWTCQGDSGGPLLVSNRLVGVTSFGVGGCGTRSRHYFVSVPRHSAMVAMAQTFEPPCEPTTEVCNGIDDDCDGDVDPGCLGLGETCADDGDCGSSLCTTVDGAQVCARACDPRAAVAQCPFGFHCEATGCGTGVCAAGEGGVPDGEACTSNVECASGRCATVGGVARCGRQCNVGAEDCAPGLACEPEADGCGTCAPYDVVTVPLPFGAPCEGDGDCASGQCVSGEGAGGDFCTRSCGETGCGNGFHCRAGTCVRGALVPPGEACIHPDDCASGTSCVTVGPEQFCLADCGEGCEEGFSCEATASGMHCVPAGLSLGEPCASSEECRSGICAGVCTRICDSLACPEGFACTPAGDVSGCFPSSEPPPPEMMGGGGGGGCAVGASSPLPWLATGLVFVAVVRRRRRRR
ncbi:MAG: S1 family peptidase [Myxococcales bacterium]|nr:S1 family peptidase [Myxococcales bacterium]